MSYSKANAVAPNSATRPQRFLSLEEIIQGVMAATKDALNFTSLAKQFSATPSSAAIQTSGGDVFTLVAGEKGFVQNLGTNPLFIRRATGASSSALHCVLAGGGANDDGTVAAIEIDDYIGVVSATGTSPRFVAWKLTI